MRENIISIIAPGRINLIGEHTDHQKGYVMPACINYGIKFFAKMRQDSRFKVYSETVGDIDEFDSNKVERLVGWKNYIRGVIKYFQELNDETKGANIWISSTLPVGSGLSSSAALEIGTFTLLETLNQKRYPDDLAVQTCWRVEKEFVGVSCGIMDQYIIRIGKKDTATLINCDDLSVEYVSLPENIGIIVLNTLISHKLSDSPYNLRVTECNNGLMQINKLGIDVSYLSQISFAEFKEIENNITDPFIRRVRHVITENERVKQFCNILPISAIEAGKLLYESHRSLRDDYEASWDRANMLIKFCKTLDGIYGARMIGAGWGGSCLLLVNNKYTEKVMKILKKWFYELFDEYPGIINPKICDGVRVCEIKPMEIEKKIGKFLERI